DVPEQIKQFFKIIRLQFKGVFYNCTVWLNEEKLGSHEGYFDVFNFDVTSFLDKENVLCVKVESREETDRGKKKQITGVFLDWDASDPLFNPGGIWNDVALIETGSTYIKYGEIKSEIIDENNAKLFLRFEVTTERAGEKKFQLLIQPKNFQGAELKEEFYEKLENGENEFTKEMVIEDAHLWWTHDHGYPYLYLLKITVEDNDKVSDESEQLFGIREFKRVIKDRSWEFFLNKKRLYIRGTNYAPCDHRIAHVEREDYERDVDLLVKGNFNMIRLHAHVDRIELHEVCAERGILIWQDFALQWAYDMKIEEEAKTQIKRMARKIQNYPSQGVYCCHNEPMGLSLKPILYTIILLLISYGLAWLADTYVGFFSNAIFWGLFILISLIFGLPATMFFYNRNKNVLDKHLMEAVLEVDDSVPVIQNSGMMGVIRKGTDLHTYEGWYMGKNYRDAYCYTRFPLKRMACFVTEYGAQSFPDLENLKKVFKEEDLWPINWKLLRDKHRCQPLFFGRWFDLNQYKNISEVIDATQEYQAELLKFYNELWRINRYKPSGGTIMFLFNDCFPGITWSIIDYWRTPKKAYYTTKLSFEPVYVMADWPKKKYKPSKTYKTRIYVVNDLHKVFSDAKVKWEILNNNKEVVTSGEFPITLQEDSIQTICEIRYNFPQDAQGTFELALSLEYEDVTIKNSYVLKIK
ncbi:MAG: hypothetical protein HWN66_19625, partial [Candidatus Helarchaeota archaeon]|nr:hypothetical protein [Candidatus Helarchaeota archaeon]